MSLQHLSIKNFRNLKQVDIDLSPHLNLFYGLNASGKTSLLEAISVLSQGQSFRSRNYKHTIHQGESAFTIFGLNQTSYSSASNTIIGGETPIPVGIERLLSGERTIRISGKNCGSAAELAQTLPIRVIDGHAFDLLNGPALGRRRFLDWLVFHVEQEFFTLWQSFEKCIKQRNHLLRHDKIAGSTIAAWNLELAEKGNQIHILREKCFELLVYKLKEVLSSCGCEGLEGISIDYKSGWNSTEFSLLEMLNQTIERDSELGYTRQGPQRCELKITVDNFPASEVLSRGQQKLFVIALYIAQARVFEDLKQQSCIFLIDDLPAELDQVFQRTLTGWLDGMASQVFVTGIEKSRLLNAWSQGSAKLNQCKVFHVKQGDVIPVSVDTSNQ